MKQAIEKRLSELIPDAGEIHSAARYSLLSGGKRYRPLLTLTTAELLGADPKAALDPACAIEMIHAYSLIHDDLPCMDDDDFRHGKPSLHKAAGEAIALLAGNFLLTYAFEVIAKAKDLSGDKKISLVETLSMRAGSKGMLGGQAIDILSIGKTIGEETLVAMHLGKTAALFTACFEFGALIAGVDPAPLRAAGEEFGLAYQFHNDLLDVREPCASFGKQAGRDAALGKPTAVSLYGIDETEKKIDRIRAQLRGRLSEKYAPLLSLVEKILQKA